MNGFTAQISVPTTIAPILASCAHGTQPLQTEGRSVSEGPSSGGQIAPLGEMGASKRMQTRDQQNTASHGRMEPVSPKRPKKDPPPGKSGKASKPKPKKKTTRGK
jgi:hypothetical protein